MSNIDVPLSEAERKEVAQHMLEGVLNRASVLCLIYVAVFGTYSLTSLSFIQLFDPSVTLLSNTWPRLLLNVLPLVAMYFFIRHPKPRRTLKVWVWSVGLPLIVMAACTVHVWRIMADIQSEIYLYVHGANAFILVTSVVVVALPPRYLLAQMTAYVFFLIAPIAYLLASAESYGLLRFAMSDYLIALPVLGFLGHSIHGLRLKLATLDVKTKKQAVSFLGPQIAKAIYEQNDDLLRSRRIEAVVVQMDIRSYSDFYRSNDAEKVRRFMSEYHSLVSRAVGEFGGYWHKSVGDAHLISFGAMDPSPADLSDLPELAGEVATAEDRRRHYLFQKAMMTIDAVVKEFETAKKKHGILDQIRIGAAMTFGDLEIRVQGDASHKRELDIDGRAIIRCARLEEYTKMIRMNVAPSSSVLVVSPELALESQKANLKTWTIDSEEKQVRNFPELSAVHYKVFGEVENSSKIVRVS